MKTYFVKEDFWIGEINKGLKAGATVEYDDGNGILSIDGQKHVVKNLKAAIKAAWLVPKDGKLPVLDGPVGETATQEADRKRKQRFADLANLENKDKVDKDTREVSRFNGAFEEGTPEYYNALGIDPSPKQRGKFTGELVEDDTKIIVASIAKSEEIKKLKTAMNQDPKEKKSIKAYEVVDDHFNDGMVNVGKYVDNNKNQTIETWGQLHWTKKADVIKTAGKDFLAQLKTIESSAKIIDRIEMRLQEL